MLLSQYIPQSIAQTNTFTTLFNVEQPEIDNLNEAIDDLINQCFVDTATWGLDYWESFLGIATDSSKDINYRRTVIKSKLRGTGTITVSLIENVANSFNNGQVQVVENPSIYTINIKFTSVKGIPPNLDDLKAAITQIMPAHLAITYSFTYNTWSMVSGYKWVDVENKTWAQLATT